MILVHAPRHRNRLSHSSAALAHPSWRGHFPQVHQILKPPALQPKLKIGAPDDKYEQEADRVADQVMRMSDTQGAQRVEGRPDQPMQIQRMCTECEEEKVLRQPIEEEDEKIRGKLTDGYVQRQEEEEEERIQAKQQPGQTQRISSNVGFRINSLKQRGQPLAPDIRNFFEPRFGQDFSRVRVHRDGNAHQLSSDMHARAFTLGDHLVFGEGEYQPGSESGKRLLAHELTHVVQQTGRRVNGVGSDLSEDGNHSTTIRRRVKVDDTVPSNANEPAKSLSQSAFRARVFPQADALIKGLCDLFQVNSSTGEVEPISGNPCEKLEGGERHSKNDLGCCCLCVITAKGTRTWSLVISEFQGPHTDTAGLKVVVHPFGSDFGFGNWAVPDSATGTERLVAIDPVTILGHELCGHAALLELDAHAASADRVRSDVHDSTVRVQNAIGREQGVAVSDDRAQARQGTHRGESTINATLTDFPFNASSISRLPGGQRRALQKIANFAVANRLWIDILGHSDTIGSSTAKLAVSQNRANAVKRFLVGEGLTEIFNRRGLAGVARYTRVEGRSDFDLLPGSVPVVRDSKLRRVEIIMTSRPAGAQNPVPATPGLPTTKVDPANAKKVADLKKSKNRCEKSLVDVAWP